MVVTILDCYTDEASGLGVPPYLGTYPRYIFGQFLNANEDVKYITIDDLRFHVFYHDVEKEVTKKDKTNIRIYNRTGQDVKKILSDTDELIINLGVHVPGKYLSAIPGTLHEVVKFLKDFKGKKVLTGPAVLGTQLEGGKFFEKVDMSFFDEVKQFPFSFDSLHSSALSGVKILDSIPYPVVIEIETGRGCNIGRCSFCTEPLKNKFSNRKMEDVLEEVVTYYEAGARYFRLGKQADFYSIDRPIELLKLIREKCEDIKVLHIDNCNPVFVVKPGGEEITKAIVKYCTPGNIAAFGIESFDPVVVKSNTLNTMPAIGRRAIEIINKYGSERGENGMPKFLPGINIIFGLKDESKKTHEENMKMLQGIYDDGLMVRRINVRQAAILPGTALEKSCGNKFLKKNKKYYWKWRNEIRQKIDYPLLQRLLPTGTILTDVYAEIYDGNTTFCRQFGTYPLIVGVKGRLPLRKFYSLKVTGHMLRSITGEVVE
jgi:radical SAM superfamily enzyme with C-terminal helix-hairpin-helix motif